jgi:hypothetical protein
MTDHDRRVDDATSAREKRAAAYAEAYAAAQPDPGHQVVTVEMEAREIDWVALWYDIHPQ